MLFKTCILFAIFVVLCFIEIIDAGAPYSDCGSEVGKIVSVDISNCKPTDKRCKLKRNTNATMTIEFTSETDSPILKAVVHGVILDVPMPFDLPNSDGCKDSDIVCPVKSNNNYKYVTSMPISTSYPRVTVDIKWELKDENNKDIICALIPAKII